MECRRSFQKAANVAKPSILPDRYQQRVQFLASHVSNSQKHSVHRSFRSGPSLFGLSFLGLSLLGLRLLGLNPFGLHLLGLGLLGLGLLCLGLFGLLFLGLCFSGLPLLGQCLLGLHLLGLCTNPADWMIHFMDSCVPNKFFTFSFLLLVVSALYTVQFVVKISMIEPFKKIC